MNDTPLTDSDRRTMEIATGYTWHVSYDFACKLERELGARNSALELLTLAVDNFLADGRPHRGRNTQFPDGCECDICQSWDRLNNARNNSDI